MSTTFGSYGNWSVCTLQLKIKKHMVAGAILFIWITMPAYEIILANLSTDIIKGSCIPWGAYSSYAMAKAIPALGFFVVFMLPLTIMVVCYSRIVYRLRTKVTLYVQITDASK